MEIALLAVLILLNGFFAMSEIGLVSARRARLQRFIDAGDRGARLAVRLGEEPTRFLSTVQIGITSIALLSGIVGEATLAPPLDEILQRAGMDPDVSTYVSTGIVVALITYFSIVVGELVPKRFGQIHAEGVARFVAFPITLLSTVSRPFVWLLTRSTELVLGVLRIREDRGGEVTEEEIHAVLDEGSKAGVIEESEKRMVRNLFRLDDRPITSMMTPRADIAFLRLGATAADILAVLEAAPHARYPVVRESVDDLLGVVSTRKLLHEVLSGRPIDLEKIYEPSLSVPGTISGRELLDQFRTGSSSVAFVVDEYGSLLGLATLHDILEAIAGDLETAPHEQSALRREDGSWLLDGDVPVGELLDRLEIRASESELEGAQTVAGLAMLHLGRVARTGDVIRFKGWQLEVVDMDRLRIDKLLATRLPEPPDEDASSG